MGIMASDFFDLSDYICPPGTANVVFSMLGFGCMYVFKSVVANRVPYDLRTNLLAWDKMKLSTAHAQNWRIFSNGCSGLRFANGGLFCSFLMTFGKNYESIFVETTWLIYREEYLSEFRWNGYLICKKFTLTEMTIELF